PDSLINWRSEASAFSLICSYSSHDCPLCGSNPQEAHASLRHVLHFLILLHLERSKIPLQSAVRRHGKIRSLLVSSAWAT
ncbi:hypothetical protein PFISCL1PPCAC_26627, partial [Pristionchus fissidentatus]